MQHIEIERVLSIVGLGAAGGVLAPMPIYGDYLTTHGFWLVSYAEWIKVLSSFYIACMLAKMSGFSLSNLSSKLIKYLRRKR